MVFWIVALTLALGVAAFVARPLVLARHASRARAAHDEQVFRDQLAEVDRDLGRGVLGPEDARSARIEVSRRLLAAAAESAHSPDHQPAPRALSRALAVLLLIGAPLGGLALYDRIGAPGMADQPFGVRVAQDVAEAGTRRMRGEPAAPEGSEALADLIARLEARLDADGADRQGLYLLARSYAEIGRFGDGWRAYRRLIAQTGGDAPAAIFSAMAESMILATEGYVSPEAEAALAQALGRDPANPVARYYMAAAFAQTGRVQSAMDTWARLLQDSPADAPWIEATRAQMRDLASTTGIAAPEVAAAPAVPDAQQREMIAGMVARLDARLAADGGTPGEWAQLVRSYTVLGQTNDAASATARARAALADRPDALAALDAALIDTPPMPAPALGGPGADDVAGAARLGAQDRGAMIEGMVARLHDRLFAGGGTPEEWARLISSYGVLGQPGAATDAWARAAEQHRADPIALAMLKETALLAGGSPQ